KKEESCTSLMQLCQSMPLANYPSKLTTLKFECTNTDGLPIRIEIENAHLNNEPLANEMNRLIDQYKIPFEHQYVLFIKLRSIRNIKTRQHRLQCVMVPILAIATVNQCLLRNL